MGLKSRIGVAACLTLFATSTAAIEFSEDFNQPSEAPRYSFDDYKFGDTDHPWNVVGVSEGGVRNSGALRADAVGRDQDDCWVGKNMEEGSFFWRACWKFTDGWQDYGLVDQKLTYIYGSGGNLNLFLHAGSRNLGWTGRGLELAHYQTSGDRWIPANSAGNEVSHTNALVLEEHYNRWICIEHEVDVDQNPWVHRYWVSTQGGSNLAPGSTSMINGRREFNDYLYLEIEHSASPASYTYLKIGAFINESAGTESMYLDAVEMSETKIGSPFVPDEVAPSAPRQLEAN